MDAALTGNPSIQISLLAQEWKSDSLPATTQKALDVCLTLDPHVHDFPYGVAFAHATLLQEVRKKMSRQNITLWSKILLRVLTHAGVDLDHPFVSIVVVDKFVGLGTHHLVLLPTDTEFQNTLTILRQTSRQAKKNSLMQRILSHLEQELVSAYGNIPDCSMLNVAIRQRLLTIKSTLLPQMCLASLQDAAEADAQAVLDKVKSVSTTTTKRHKTKAVYESDIVTCMTAVKQGGVSREGILAMAPMMLSYKMKPEHLIDFLSGPLLDTIHSNLAKGKGDSIVELLLPHMSSTSAAIRDVAYLCIRDSIVGHNKQSTKDFSKFFEVNGGKQFLTRALADPSVDVKMLMGSLCEQLQTESWRYIVWEAFEENHARTIEALQSMERVPVSCPLDIEVLLFPTINNIKKFKKIMRSTTDWQENVTDALALSRSVVIGCDHVSEIEEAVRELFKASLLQNMNLTEICINGLRHVKGDKTCTLADIALQVLSCNIESLTLDHIAIMCSIVRRSSTTAESIEAIVNAVQHYSRSTLDSAVHFALWRLVFALLLEESDSFQGNRLLLEAARNTASHELSPLLGFTFTQLVRQSIQHLPTIAQDLFSQSKHTDIDAVGMNPTKMNSFFEWFEQLEFHKDSAAHASLGCTAWLLSIRNINTVWGQCCAQAAAHRPKLASMFFEALRMEVLDTYARVQTAPDDYVCIAYVACQFALAVVRSASPAIPSVVRTLLGSMVSHQETLRSLPPSHSQQSSNMAKFILDVMNRSVAPSHLDANDDMDHLQPELSAAMPSDSPSCSPVDAAHQYTTDNMSDRLRMFVKYQSAASLLREIVGESCSRHNSESNTPCPIPPERNTVHQMLLRFVKGQNPTSALRDLSVNIPTPMAANQSATKRPQEVDHTPMHGLGSGNLFEKLKKLCQTQKVDSALKDLLVLSTTPTAVK